jgi:hypothetical protein
LLCEFDRTVGAAIIRNEDFAFHSGCFESRTRFLDAGDERFRLVQAGITMESSIAAARKLRGRGEDRVWLMVSRRLLLQRLSA